MADSAASRSAAGVSAGAARGHRPGTLPLLARQFRYQSLLFWRNPFSAFFTMVFPLMFLVLFNSLQGGSRLVERGGIRFSQFFTPGILVFAVVSATYVNLAVSVSIARDEGILKRLRGTPLPAWVYVAGRVLQATYAAVLASVLMVAVGVLLFHVKLIGHLLPAAIVTLLVGIMCFCALGLALAAVCPNGETAPAMANFTWLPVAFISPIFYPLNQAPQWLQTLGDVFPVKHFAQAMQAAFSPATRGSGFRWGDLGVIALWALGGAIVAILRFQWEPRAVSGGRRRGRRAAVEAGGEE
jgi:ABC-2 type transport system permease protein